MESISCPILPFLFIFEHAEIRLVARFANVVLFDSLTHSTARFVAMGTIAIAAFGRGLENFREVVANFLFFHVEGTETFDAWSIDEVAASFEGEHLGEGGGVHAFVVGGGYLARAGCGVGQDGIDEGGLAHARVAGQKGNASAQLGLEEVDARASLLGRDLEAGIADSGIEVDEAVQVVEVVGIVGVYLVEDELDGDAIGFGRGEEAVDERGRRFGVVDGNDEHALVEVGRDDVRLLREVRGTADDVVAPVFDFADEGSAFLIEQDVYVVAHRHGVGAANTLQAEVAFDLALDAAPVFRLDEIPAACILDDKPFH